MILQQAKEQVNQKLTIWKSFDEYASAKRKDTKYFKPGRPNFELYYKVAILEEDLREFFLK